MIAKIARASEHATVELLSAYLDDQLAADEAQHLAAHLAGCERCHQRLVGLRDVASSVRSLEKVVLPPGFEKMVARRIALEEKNTHALDRFETLLTGFGRQSPFLGLFAVVIALAAIFLLFSQALHHKQHQTTPILFDPPPTENTGGKVDEVVLERWIADRRMLRSEDGWRQEGVDREAATRSLGKSSPEGDALFAEHPELRQLAELPGTVVFALDEEVIELR